VGAGACAQDRYPPLCVTFCIGPFLFSSVASYSDHTGSTKMTKSIRFEGKSHVSSLRPGDLFTYFATINHGKMRYGWEILHQPNGNISNEGRLHTNRMEKSAMRGATKGTRSPVWS